MNKDFKSNTFKDKSPSDDINKMIMKKRRKRKKPKGPQVLSFCCKNRDEEEFSESDSEDGMNVEEKVEDKKEEKKTLPKPKEVIIPERKLKELLLQKHTKFISGHIKKLPFPYASQDQNRLMLLYFTISALDLTKTLDKFVQKDFRERIIKWIYSLQILPKHKNNEQQDTFGFIGGPYNGKDNWSHHLNCSHVTMTYTSLLSLLILGDDLKGVDKESIKLSLGKLQLPEGNFKSTKMDESGDVRFIFSVISTCALLNDFSTIDVSKVCEYLMKCNRYDGGFAHVPNGESHSGSTFCVISSLFLMKKLDILTKLQKGRLIKWLLSRQINGFNGRPNKLQDTCYTFWISSTLHHLGVKSMIDKERLINFVLNQQNTLMGGIGKTKEVYPDLMHCYLSMCGLSIVGYNDFTNTKAFEEVYPALNISKKALGKMLESLPNPPIDVNEG